MMCKVFTLILLLVLNSCANSRKTDRPAPKTPNKRSQTEKTTKVSKVNSPKKEVKVSRAVFHLVHPLHVELQVTNSENGQKERILVDKTLSQLEMVPGIWQVHGLVKDGRAYEVQGKAGMFTFEVKKGTPTYVGSYIIQCPHVGKEHNPEIKKMAFFNRYPLGDEEGQCEMIVGNAHNEVNKVWKKLVKESRSLKLGF